MGKKCDILRNFYLPFIPKAKVNYLYLFRLYRLVQWDEGKERIKNTINYSSTKELAGLLDISKSTVDRLLVNAEYRPFLSVDKTKKQIILHNNFKGNEGQKQPFVCLSLKEVVGLEEYNDNLLIKYYLYIKYYVGHSKNKDNDFTINQFLTTIGLQQNTSYVSTVSSYNTLLKEKGFIKITNFRDANGYPRNKYQLCYS